MQLTIEEFLAKHCVGVDDHDYMDCRKCAMMKEELTEMLNSDIRAAEAAAYERAVAAAKKGLRNGVPVEVAILDICSPESISVLAEHDKRVALEARHSAIMECLEIAHRAVMETTNTRTMDVAQHIWNELAQLKGGEGK